jgi:hypothetical protein
MTCLLDERDMFDYSEPRIKRIPCKEIKEIHNNDISEAEGALAVELHDGTVYESYNPLRFVVDADDK